MRNQEQNFTIYGDSSRRTWEMIDRTMIYVLTNFRGRSGLPIERDRRAKIPNSFSTSDRCDHLSPDSERKEETSKTILKSPSTDLNLSESTAIAISGTAAPHAGVAIGEIFQTVLCGLILPRRQWLGDTKVGIHLSRLLLSSRQLSRQKPPSKFL
ncbi:hypothetical protein HAX54_036623 [Datura stramonium]|uniref:Uncharacterized protein n=1 Tax=Datura stramonium TaxID=4076 RepID=A0ABS8VIC9_DATST|nr:hypothetical protein [Datura stramonium]